jgi:4-hydroxy-tetrahydrodipicolinate reductase
MIKVAVTGACGRMGSGIIRTILEQDDMAVVAAIEVPNSPFIGKDIGEHLGLGTTGVKVSSSDDLEETLEESSAEALVDFTIAFAAVETAKKTSDCGVNLVVGTTGISNEQLDEIREYVTKNNIKAVISPNMAIGVNVFFKILKDLAPLLEDYDIEIIEAHHKHKKDAPSGTAVKAFKILAEATNRDTEEVGIYGREGLVGERTQKEIGIHAVRGGDIVGDHTVMFAGDGERIEIVHRANTRQAFINGVIKSLRFLPNATSGEISDMNDVLGIK